MWCLLSVLNGQNALNYLLMINIWKKDPLMILLVLKSKTELLFAVLKTTTRDKSLTYHGNRRGDECLEIHCPHFWGLEVPKMIIFITLCHDVAFCQYIKICRFLNMFWLRYYYKHIHASLCVSQYFISRFIKYIHFYDVDVILATLQSTLQI